MNKVLKLVPAAKDYLWGGTKLPEKYGKVTDCRPCAETWELSLHPDGLTRTEDGRTLAEVLTPEDLGTACAEFPFFPLLIKFIDAHDNLSVQVHPSDEYALEHEHSYGKTEMWVIVEAEEGAGIYLGLRRDVTRDELEAAIAGHTLTDLLNFIPVHAGESYFIPAGTLHAIGRGCLIYEVQQNSNLTYRVYDYGRRGKDGKERELHVEKALRVVNLNKREPETFEPMEGEVLALCRYFTVKRIHPRGRFTFLPTPISFRCISVTAGSGYIDGRAVRAGDSFFVPAGVSCAAEGDMTLIVSSAGRNNI